MTDIDRQRAIEDDYARRRKEQRDDWERNGSAMEQRQRREGTVNDIDVRRQHVENLVRSAQDMTDEIKPQIDELARVLALAWLVYCHGDPWDGRQVERVSNAVLTALEATR